MPRLSPPLDEVSRGGDSRTIADCFNICSMKFLISRLARWIIDLKQVQH